MIFLIKIQTRVWGIILNLWNSYKKTSHLSYGLCSTPTSDSWATIQGGLQHHQMLRATCTPSQTTHEHSAEYIGAEGIDYRGSFHKTCKVLSSRAPWEKVERKWWRKKHRGTSDGRNPQKWHIHRIFTQRKRKLGLSNKEERLERNRWRIYRMREETSTPRITTKKER